MKRKILSCALSLVFLLTFITPATAVAPVEVQGRLMDYPLPGDLNFYGDVYDFLSAYIDPAELLTYLNTDPQLLNVLSAPYHSCITVDNGVITIDECALCDWDIGYVYADAVGKLNADLNVQVTMKPGSLVNISAADLFAILPDIKLASSGFTVNTSMLQTIFPSLSFSMDLSELVGQIPPFDISGLEKEGFTQWPFLLIDLPYSFGYSFGDSLTNGTYTALSTSDAVNSSWLKELDNQHFSVNGSYSDLSLAALLPQNVLDMLDSVYPDWVLYDPSALIWDAVWAQLADLANDRLLTDGLLVPLSKDILVLINTLIAQYNASVSYSFLKVAPLAAADADHIAQGLKTFVSTNLPSWGNTIRDGVGAKVNGVTSFDPGAVKTVKLAGVKSSALSYALGVTSSVQSNTITAGNSLQLNCQIAPAPPAGAKVSYDYTVLSGNATVTTGGLVRGVGAGSATIEVTATVTCGNLKETYTQTVSITINSIPVYDDPVNPPSPSPSPSPVNPLPTQPSPSPDDPIAPVDPVDPVDPDDPVNPDESIDEEDIPLVNPGEDGEPIDTPDVPLTGGFPVPLIGLAGLALISVGVLLRSKKAKSRAR